LAFYEQSGGSLALFAKDNLRNNLLFFEINPNIVNNTSNSFFVIIFSPIVGFAMAKKKIEPNTVIKFGIVLVLAAAFMCSTIRFFADAEGLTSLNVLLWRI
jgi:POT family proton-dependent oligopeptide transporter